MVSMFKPYTVGTRLPEASVFGQMASYREQALLGRPLTPGEIRHFTHVARRLARLCLLEAELGQVWTTLFMP